MPKRSRRNSEADSYRQVDISMSLLELTESRNAETVTRPDVNPFQVEFIDGFEEYDSDNESVGSTATDTMDTDSSPGKSHSADLVEDNYSIREDPELLETLSKHP